MSQNLEMAASPPGQPLSQPKQRAMPNLLRLIRTPGPTHGTITGLSATWRVRRRGPEDTTPCDMQVIHARRHASGFATRRRRRYALTSLDAVSTIWSMMLATEPTEPMRPAASPNHTAVSSGSPSAKARR